MWLNEGYLFQGPTPSFKQVGFTFPKCTFIRQELAKELKDIFIKECSIFVENVYHIKFLTNLNILLQCPLCMEPLEIDDINFFPCTCGYQVYNLLNLACYLLYFKDENLHFSGIKFSTGCM